MRALLVVLLVGGCSTEALVPPPPAEESPSEPSGEGEGEEASATFTYHQDVAPLLAGKCTGCHTATGIAPFSLDNYSDAALFKDLIADAVETGVMPPFYADPSCNEYEGDPSLTADEIAMLRTWANENAPEGDPSTAAPLPSLPELAPASVVASMPAAYTQVQEPDENRCFLLDPIDVPAGQFITGFRVIPGNADVVHHILVFLVPPESVADIDASPDGFDCNGGMVSSRGGGLIGAWAPGGLGTDMPAGLGVAIEPGSRIVVQMHYNSNKSGPQADQTQIGLVLSPSVEKEAKFFFFTDPRWLTDGGMLIPAGDVVSFESAVQADLVRRLDAQSIEIYGAAIHMHQRGQDGYLRVNDDECVVDLERWDFNWQQSYQPKQPVIMRRGDTLHLGCTFDNTGGTTDAQWGEGTNDEMCLGALLVVVNQ